MSACVWLLSSFGKNKIYIQNFHIVNSDGWLKMKLLNQTFLTEITIGKGDRLAYLFVLNTTGKTINNAIYIKS